MFFLSSPSSWRWFLEPKNSKRVRATERHIAVASVVPVIRGCRPALQHSGQEIHENHEKLPRAEAQGRREKWVRFADFVHRFTGFVQIEMGAFVGVIKILWTEYGAYYGYSQALVNKSA